MLGPYDIRDVPRDPLALARERGMLRRGSLRARLLRRLLIALFVLFVVSLIAFTLGWMMQQQMTYDLAWP